LVNMKLSVIRKFLKCMWNLMMEHSFVNMFLKSSRLVNILMKEFVNMKLSVIKEFFFSPDIRCQIGVILDQYVEVDNMFIPDVVLEMYTGEKIVYFKEPIMIPRLRFPMLEEPVLDQVFKKTYLFELDDSEYIMFPEEIYELMYSESLKGKKLESFICSEWDEGFRNKVRSYLTVHGMKGYKGDHSLKGINRMISEETDEL
jgi:hypothetical protein